MLSQSASWGENPIFEGVRNFDSQAPENLLKNIMSYQAEINNTCKTLSNGVFHERSALHLAIDEFLEPDIIQVLINHGADCHSIMTQIEDSSISTFDCFQRLEHIRATCIHPSSGETEKLAHLNWCGRTFTNEWCQTVCLLDRWD
jgi:hypothetical protein